MFVHVVCSLCGKPFQVPESVVGQSSTCPWCQGTVLALPVAGSPAADKPTTGSNVDAKKPAEVLSLDDDAPGSPPATSPDQTVARTSRRQRLRFGLLSVAMAALAMVVTLSLMRYKQGYLIGWEWQPFSAPDGSCSIDLPGQPREEDVDPATGERRYKSEGWYSGAKAWIGWRGLTAAQVQEASSDKGWVELRKSIFDPERERLQRAFSGYVARDGTISQSPLTVEVRLESPRERLIERIVVMPGGSRPRVYFLGMSGRRLDLDGPHVGRFFASFHAFD